MIPVFRRTVGGSDRHWLVSIATVSLAWLVSVGLVAPDSAKTSKSGAASAAARDIVVHASELPKQALSEFEFWKEPAAPGGQMVGTANHGDELDAPPEDDPNVTFKITVVGGVPYSLWLHMKTGKPKGKSKANMIYAQFSGAVDEGKDVFKPRTKSYLTLRAPASEGWAWVGPAKADAKAKDPVIRFKESGEVTVRLQAGMEGVGFDQFVLSPQRFLGKPPAEAVVEK